MKNFQKIFYIFGSSIFTLFVVFAILVATGVIALDDVNKILSNSSNSDVINEIRNNIESSNTTTNETTQKVGRKIKYEDYLKKGNDFIEQGFLNLATEQYLKANEEKPSEPEPLVKIGEIKYLQKDYQTAIEIFNQALSKNKDTESIKIWIGKTYIRLRNFDEARKIFTNLNAGSIEGTYYQAVLDTYFKNHQEAINNFNSIISSGDSIFGPKAQIFIDAYSEFNLNQQGQTSHLDALLSKAYDQNKEYELTIGTLFETLKIEPKYRDAWILLGHSYLKLEKYPEAIDTLEEAKRLDPNKPETLYFLGLAYFGDNDLQNAINSLEISLKNGFQPEIQAYQKLAEYYLQAESYLNAVEAYNKVIDLNGTNVNYYVRPMWIYIEALNKPNEALQLAEKALSENPDEAMSFNLLAWAYIANNNLEKAKTNLDTALSIDPNLAAAYLNYGLYYEGIGDFDKAKENYQKAHTQGSGDAISNMAAQKYNDLTKKIEEQ